MVGYCSRATALQICTEAINSLSKTIASLLTVSLIIVPNVKQSLN